MFAQKVFLAAALSALAAPAAAQSGAATITADSCVGQLIQVYTAGEPSGLVLSVVNQATHAGVNVLVSPQVSSVVVQNVASPTFAVIVPMDWKDAVLTMTRRAGYDISAYLRYHMNGTSYVVEDFRLTQGLSPSPDCR